MFELAYGRIIIDGYNLASVPLHHVRSRVAIIPQVRGHAWLAECVGGYPAGRGMSFQNGF